MIAVVSKTMNGNRQGQASTLHVLPVLDHATGTVLAQEQVADRSVPTLWELLEPLDPDGAVVAVDAMHTQVDTAEWITQRGGRCLLTVQGNQKTLHRKSEGSAMEERPVHILGRRLSWAASTTHPQGPRGSQVGGVKSFGVV